MGMYRPAVTRKSRAPIPIFLSSTKTISISRDVFDITMFKLSDPPLSVWLIHFTGGMLPRYRHWWLHTCFEYAGLTGAGSSGPGRAGKPRRRVVFCIY